MKNSMQLAITMAGVATAAVSLPGQSSFVVPTAFPTNVFSTYYVKPAPTAEPQPVIVDPVLNITFPFNITNPASIPTFDSDPVYYPVPVANITNTTAQAYIAAAVSEILNIVSANNSAFTSNCSRCVAALGVAQFAAKIAPSYLPDAMVALCKSTGFASNKTCEQTYAATSYGAPWTQILAYADVAGLDGRYICWSLSSTFCSYPTVTPYKANFPKLRPNVTKPVKRSGKLAKVFHMSDIHLDPRYTVGGEGNCASGQCCRPSTALANGSLPAISVPAPLFGYFKCDSPYFLTMAAMQAIGPLTGTSLKDPPALTVYTGDIVTHETSQAQISRGLVEDVEDSMYQQLKAYIGGPIYIALGNHDSNPENTETPQAIDNNGTLGQQFSWNYKHVSALWKYYGWLDEKAAAEAAVHYAAYSVKSPAGVRIISLNSDLYYRANIYAFLHAANPDYSGLFSFLITELQKAEDAGERVWIIGHVLTGWDGGNALPNGADLFQQIVERYSPHVIANIFFGHSHEDQAFVFYSNNGTNQTAGNAIANAWVGPSVTPLTNLNSGFRMYQVDTGSWEVFEAYTYVADVSSFSSLSSVGPTWKFEYSHRDAYGKGANWTDPSLPLNGTFWHKVTEAMEQNKTLVSLFNTYQGKSSVLSPNCTSDACAQAKVCYLRSGNTALGKACPQGFGSVQSPFTGKNF